MVRKVLITYESSPMSEVAFLISQIGIGNTTLEQRMTLGNINTRSNKLIEQLTQAGIEVVYLRDVFSGGHTDGTFKRGVQVLAEESDLILHDPTRFFHYLNHEVADAYRLQTDEVIRDFLWKTHLEGKNPFTTDKRKTLEIVNQHGGGIKTPRIWTIDEFLSDPKYPAVFQARFLSMGKSIHYIPDSATLSEVMTKGVDFYRNVADVYQFIETPSDHFTSYRIITFADGTILGAILQASERTITSSGYTDITSNHATGSVQIPLNPIEASKFISEHDYAILREHGISRESVQLPAELKKQASKVARLFSQYGVVWGGQDWLQDRKGNFYFKEINFFPGMETFNTLCMKGVQTDDYREQNEIDKQAQRIGIEMIVKAIKEYNPVRY